MQIVSNCGQPAFKMFILNFLGGGFGGKDMQGPYGAVLAAAAAKKYDNNISIMYFLSLFLLHSSPKEVHMKTTLFSEVPRSPTPTSGDFNGYLPTADH